MSDVPGWVGLLLDGTPRAAAIFDADGGCLARNRRFELWVGGEVKLLPGESAGELLARMGYEPLEGGLWRGQGRTLRGELERGEGYVAAFYDPVGPAVPDPRLRGRFLSVASHDLRGKLANVRSYASLLKSPRFGLDERALKAVDTIARNADRALELSEDVFDLLKAEAGSLRAERTPVDPRPLLELALSRARPSAEEKEALLSLDADALAPFPLDPDRFGRACRALLEHAIARTPVRGHAGLLARRDGSSLEVRAWDEAEPPDPQTLGYLYDRDARVAHERKLGAGFYLALAGALAQAQGGAVGHGPDEKGRQTFFFTIPEA